MKEPSKEQIKERAKFLREVLREKHKIELPHGHALEVLAKVFGYKDWNTASASSTDGRPAEPVETRATTESVKPIAAKFHTVGELKEFLSKFDDETKLVVNEYKWTELNANDYNFGTVTSVCSLTYDGEIQEGNELRLELNTETEQNDFSFGKSASQRFDRTRAGRSQRRIKYLELFKSSIWNSVRKS